MRYLFILLMAISCSVNGWTQEPSKVIPVFQFSTLDGAVFNPTNLTTGKMSFFVFVDTDCDHCQHAMQYINQHHGEFKKAAVYLVSMANPARINEFMSRYGANLVNQKHVVLLQDTRYDFISKFKPQKTVTGDPRPNTNARGNVGFCDGHAEFLSRKEAISQRYSGPRP